MRYLLTLGLHCIPCRNLKTAKRFTQVSKAAWNYTATWKAVDQRLGRKASFTVQGASVSSSGTQATHHILNVCERIRCNSCLQDFGCDLFVHSKQQPLHVPFSAGHRAEGPRVELSSYMICCHRLSKSCLVTVSPISCTVFAEVSRLKTRLPRMQDLLTLPMPPQVTRLRVFCHWIL